MFIDFTIENFRSVGQQVTLSMERIKRLREKDVDACNIIETGVADTHLLKSIAMYGANASGKSNVIRALAYMQELVKDSAKDTQKGEPISYEPFAFSPARKEAPTFLEIRFILDGDLFRYGFEVTKEQFQTEWLFQNEKELFTREEDTITCSKQFKEGKGVEKRTRENALFLSVCAQWDGDISGRILEQFFAKLHVISAHNDGYPALTASLLGKEEYQEIILTALRAADVGISDVKTAEKNMAEEIEELPKELRESILEKLTEDGRKIEDLTVREISMLHGESGKVLPLGEESDGTRKLFGLLGPVIDTIHNGEILVIDEFNDRLHPLLARALVKMFNNKSNSEAQLVFATHDTNMLTQELFRRDQIWFAEKNNNLETDLYSLAEYRLDDGSAVRQDASYAKDYLRGRYGAIPYFGEFPFADNKDGK